MSQCFVILNSSTFRPVYPSAFWPFISLFLNLFTNYNVNLFIFLLLSFIVYSAPPLCDFTSRQPSLAISFFSQLFDFLTLPTFSFSLFQGLKLLNNAVNNDLLKHSSLFASDSNIFTLLKEKGLTQLTSFHLQNVFEM